MARKHILLEVTQQTPDAFGYNAVLFEAPSTADAEHASEAAIADLGGYGLELEDDIAPVPMFETKECVGPLWRLSTEMASSSPETATDMAANTLVVPCSVRSGDHERLCRHEGVNVWPNSELTLFSDDSDAEEPFLDAVAAASSAGGMDCRPFRPGVPVSTIRHLLGVEALWRQGYRGQNVIVGIVDDGVDATTYPVIGGFSRPGSGRLPGAAPVTSHGSMCAADLLIAAPASRLYDYPFIGVPRSGGALQMYQAILNQRRVDGTPHVTNNSYGFVSVPTRSLFPHHEVHDINHPLHRKVREVVQSGASVFFAAGNCGRECPSSGCHSTGIGPGRSIHASNSLADVVTVAAVNSHHERIGYSSQGEGMFDQKKPDVAAYSHIYANFGPGRPGGTAKPFDSGTSTASPVAAGVAALLLSVLPETSPVDLKRALLETATQVGSDVGWNRDFGYGVVNAAAAFDQLKRLHAMDYLTGAIENYAHLRELGS
jgi:subtilisin family serine protease